MPRTAVFRRRMLVALAAVVALSTASPALARTPPQAFLGASVFAVCPGTPLKRLDTDLHIVIEEGPRSASVVDLIFSGTFRPLEPVPNQDLFKKKFKGTFAVEFECGDGTTIPKRTVTSSSLGGDEMHHIVFTAEVDLDACPVPVLGWATFDAKGGSVNKKLVGDPVPLNFSFCALTADDELNIVPNSFFCDIVHPLADQCP